MNEDLCPLCYQNQKTEVFNVHVKNRKFFHCTNCDMIFVPPQFHCSEIEERARYATHENSSHSAGYREFLLKFVSPVRAVLDEKMKKKIELGIDYGCGPGPLLSELIGQLPGLNQGIQMVDWDPYFRNQPRLTERQYDLVVATEVVEHFRQPAHEWKKMSQLVKSKGVLAVMTQFHQGIKHFETWWYAKDFTHICFYSATTLNWWANQNQFQIEYLENPVVVMSQK